MRKRSALKRGVILYALHAVPWFAHTWYALFSSTVHWTWLGLPIHCFSAEQILLAVIDWDVLILALKAMGMWVLLKNINAY